MGYKHTFDIIYTHFQGITNHISMVLEDLFFVPSFFTRPQPVLHISTRPYSFLPVQMTGGRVSR